MEFSIAGLVCIHMSVICMSANRPLALQHIPLREVAIHCLATSSSSTYVKSPRAYVKELEKKIDVIGIYSVSSLSQTVVFNALLLLLA